PSATLADGEGQNDFVVDLDLRIVEVANEAFDLGLGDLDDVVVGRRATQHRLKRNDRDARGVGVDRLSSAIEVALARGDQAEELTLADGVT
ncbi:hypothetical protein DKP78_19405, partial [Enterococcus faecium]